MSLLRRAVDGITRPTATVSKPPVGDRFTGMMLGGPARTLSVLNLMQASGWLFACVDRIAASVSAIQWNLYAKAANPATPPKQIIQHPLLDLWARPNQFYTNQEFVEVSVQHFELAGEIWWLVLRNVAGVPVEMWPIRPDRIKPVPSRDEYIAGYVYQVGAEVIPLSIDDVIFIRRPSPVDAYRGIGVVGSILSTIATEQQAQEWTAQFFRNNAEPGGIIEFDQELDDASFDRIVQRWRTQHQGTQNAHRVAVIERGKWVDRAYTNRDIQLEQLRRLDRDLILGAFGMPASALGITENVNRANAEAGQFALSQNIVLPRLRRIQGEINQTLCPMFGEGLTFEFVDPTPEYRELDITEATEGYKSGILTRDEARERLGEPPAAEGGDQFYVAPAPVPFGGGQPAALMLRNVRKTPLELTDAQDTEESRIRRGWTRRLAAEAEALTGYLEQLKGQTPRKIELSDLAKMDFDWWSKYADEVIAELMAAYSIALTDVEPSMAPGEVQRRASLYANTRGARLLKLDGDLNIAEATRRRVNEIVGQALENGDGLQAIQRQLRDDFIFSRERATMVARTETATALGQGTREVAYAQGRDQKRWVTQGFGSNVDQPCLDNEAQGWIDINELFQSGMDTIPAHIQCRCVVRYRTAELHLEAVQEFRCEECGKLLATTPGSLASYWCSRCKVSRTAPEMEGRLIRREVKRVERNKEGEIAAVVVEEREFGNG